ncbi:hypothetical protein COCSUDRAFT_33344 [Coccomyxa subellipsoidea C-169]|uniref:Uncharacterized protein n=1 Tax=Coccomyxa subellipsoidea (strain C-169) TaxID=574566 RepID=I0YW50_COCSC|nr:hypothetical protein COCSUDRAFT_33344 [Coccomyxa subellipsoidea C-169]EIE22619.1 hypothetical protein COCSUDRAFT_33344 [Coccomyxa subellipsoidea C-169]|eukprot:XP_005647163.1 hypothetical protein COCSUDRAFT_33344 [Coccomyxa subellipsoidea C-169]
MSLINRPHACLNLLSTAHNLNARHQTHYTNLNNILAIQICSQPECCCAVVTNATHVWCLPENESQHTAHNTHHRSNVYKRYDEPGRTVRPATKTSVPSSVYLSACLAPVASCVERIPLLHWHRFSQICRHPHHIAVPWHDTEPLVSFFHLLSNQTHCASRIYACPIWTTIPYSVQNIAVHCCLFSCIHEN